MSQRKRSSFNVDSLLGNDMRIGPPSSNNSGHIKSPYHHQQNIISTHQFVSSNFENQLSRTTLPSHWERRYDAPLNTNTGGTSLGPEFGSASTQTIPGLAANPLRVTTQQAHASALMSDIQPPNVDLNTQTQASPKGPTNIGPVFGGAAMTQPNDVAPMMPSTAALATYSLFNWCAKCNCSFRMTSDLVHHMRTHHKRRRTVND